MIVTCDRCHEGFDGLLKEQTKKIDGRDIIHTYLQCPHCKSMYMVCYDSPSTLVLKKQMQKHKAMLQTIRDEKQYRNKLKDIEKKKKRLEREMKILQSKYFMYFEEREG